MILTAVAYLADAVILGSYGFLARTGRSRPFHWANAVGCVPLLAVEVVAHAWPPLVLTAAFGAIGLAGLVRSTG